MEWSTILIWSDSAGKAYGLWIENIMTMVAPALVVAIVGMGLAFCLTFSVRSLLPNFLASFAVAFVPIIVGFASAASREPATGEVLPVVLTGVGLLSVYSVIQARLSLVLASALAIVFSASLLGGFFLGATNRYNHVQPVFHEQEVVNRNPTLNDSEQVLDRTGDDIPLAGASQDIVTFTCPKDAEWCNGLGLLGGINGPSNPLFNVAPNSELEKAIQQLSRELQQNMRGN
jgi:hypothetical protein